MEKTKTNKKSKTSLIVLLVAILLCIAVVLGMGGFTYAKYISRKTVETQKATVAKWGYVISADTSKLFGKNYLNNNIVTTTSPAATAVDVQAASNNENNVVAPGTSGSMTFSITGSAEVRSKITIAANSDTSETYTTVQLLKDGTSIYEPIKWTLTDKNGTSGSNTTTYESYDKMIAGLKDLAKDYGNINPNNENVNLSYELSWKWALEGTETNANLYDTILGAIMAYDSTATGDDANVFWGPDGEKIVLTKSDDTVTATVTDNNGTVTAYTATTTVSLDLKISVEQIQGTSSTSTQG